MSENKYYHMTIAGCERDLPICPIDEHLDIAGFVMLGDVEITEKTAKALLEKCPEHDVVVTAETKGIPLCYEMARQGCRRYIVARKSVKAYMRNPIHVEVKSITTDHVQKLYLAEDDYKGLNGKRVLIVDDVISTGESLAAMETWSNSSAAILWDAPVCSLKAMRRTARISSIWSLAALYEIRTAKEYVPCGQKKPL